MTVLPLRGRIGQNAFLRLACACKGMTVWIWVYVLFTFLHLTPSHALWVRVTPIPPIPESASDGKHDAPATGRAKLRHVSNDVHDATKRKRSERMPRRGRLATTAAPLVAAAPVPEPVTGSRGYCAYTMQQHSQGTESNVARAGNWQYCVYTLHDAAQTTKLTKKYTTRQANR